MIEIEVDGKKILTQKKLNILESLKCVSIEIPNLCESFVEDKTYCCRLCMVKVKRAGEDSYKLSLACKEIVEEGMSILNEDEEIINYRVSILISILHSHKPVCEGCSGAYFCKLKKYLNIYNVDINYVPKEDYGFSLEENSKNENRKLVIENISNSVQSDFSRCINCRICESYKSIYGYKTMILDFCPVSVFETKRKKENIIDDIGEFKSYCLGCYIMCKTKYYASKKNIVSAHSFNLKKYGICDFGREMSYYDENKLEHPLKNGYEETFENVAGLYREFFSDFETSEVGASLSLFYPLEDIKMLEDECLKLGIKIFGYRKNGISTNTAAKKNRLVNYNAVMIKDIKYKYDDTIDIFEYSLYKELKKFLIVSDPFLEKDESFIKFVKEHKGNYILFTSHYSIAAINAYVAFPISGFGELSGVYFDKYGKEKYISSILQTDKLRPNIRDLLSHLDIYK